LPVSNEWIIAEVVSKPETSKICRVLLVLFTKYAYRPATNSDLALAPLLVPALALPTKTGADGLPASKVSKVPLLPK